MKNNLLGKLFTLTQSTWMRPALIALILSVVVHGVTGCNKSTPSERGAQAHQYTCPMHPEVVKDAPGNCPKCGMKLVEKK
jgi:hypothetical protein